KSIATSLPCARCRGRASSNPIDRVRYGVTSRPMFATVFIVVALLHLIPVWSVNHLPTTDGPCHTYNAWILHQLITGRSPFLARYYAIDWRPHPYWLGHAVMAAAMSIVPPAVAEKVFFSVILLVFFA